MAGFRVPLYACEALVLGSGAAGLRAAVELKRRGVDVVVATQNLYGGTSACSGSDKQTLHTACGSGRGDDFDALAAALGAGGAMDEDTAYVEAVGSLGALASLQFMGLPVPLDAYGAVLRYKTDHDEAGRATSCGPRTSRLMVRALAEESARLGVPVVNRSTGAQILVDQRRVVGLLAFNSGDRTSENPLGLAVFPCEALVIAAGGPGELYRDSVYPKHCFGALGLALEAGIEAVNLTESQFGIGTPRDGFPWNLSGTYAQCLPYIYSSDASGKERNFLADYYRTTQELASNIFRKGYQWPFHASRMLDFGSSLVDLAIFRETQAGRTVSMDFNRNPEPVPGDAPFSLDRLDADVRAYLANNEALLASPIERLARMNPLSIELYKRYKKDITREPLAFAVNNQHMNGGIAVDIWGRTQSRGLLRHRRGRGNAWRHAARRRGAQCRPGVRPALRRAYRRERSARFRAMRRRCAILEAAIEAAIGGLHGAEGIDWREIEREVQARMSDHAGFICSRRGRARRAVGRARAQRAHSRAWRAGRPSGPGRPSVAMAADGAGFRGGANRAATPISAKAAAVAARAQYAIPRGRLSRSPGWGRSKPIDFAPSARRIGRERPSSVSSATVSSAIPDRSVGEIARKRPISSAIGGGFCPGRFTRATVRKRRSGK